MHKDLKPSITILALTLLLCPITAQAQNEDDDTYISLSVENDNLGGGTDRYYTSGVRLTWFDSDFDAPNFIKRMADTSPTFKTQDETAAFYTFGHNLYTPEDITIENQPPEDRPWAAFLYGSIGLANIRYDHTGEMSRVDEIEFTLGLVGPEALGKPIQRFVHKYISNSPDPKGWKNQLDFEPGLILSWQRRFPNALSYDFDPIHARLEPNISASLGNIRTNAGVGLNLVFGSTKELDTPPRVRPAIPGTGYFNSENIIDWQVFAGVEGRLVARDIFLDGNTFSDSHSVDKKYLVGDFSAGASAFYEDYRLSYTINMRSKEFDGQDEESVFGSITLTKRF